MPFFFLSFSSPSPPQSSCHKTNMVNSNDALPVSCQCARTISFRKILPKADLDSQGQGEQTHSSRSWYDGELIQFTRPNPSSQEEHEVKPKRTRLGMDGRPPKKENCTEYFSEDESCDLCRKIEGRSCRDQQRPATGISCETCYEKKNRCVWSKYLATRDSQSKAKCKDSSDPSIQSHQIDQPLLSTMQQKHI